MGRPLWASDELARVARRREAHDELDEHIADWTARKTVDAVVEHLRAHGVPAGAVLPVEMMYDDAQLNARGYYVALENDRTGVRRYPAWPMRFSIDAPTQRTGPPTLGRHNAEILRELGVDDGELEQLAKEQVIGDRVIT